MYERNAVPLLGIFTEEMEKLLKAPVKYFRMEKCARLVEGHAEADIVEIGAQTGRRENTGIPWGWDIGHYELRNSDNALIANFTLSEFPGCCGLVILCYLEVTGHARRQGVGALLARQAERIAKTLGFSLLIGTDTSNNTPTAHITKANDWRTLDSVVNTRTSHHVALYAKHLS